MSEKREKDEEEVPVVQEARLWRIPKWFPDISAEVSDKLRAFHFELNRFNGRMNLISPRTEREGDLIHFSDCIMGAQAIFKYTEAKKIFDIGSGNGLPGIVMAVLDPNRQFVLIDKDARKVEFLKHVIHRLGLTNAKAHQVRLEELKLQSIDCAVSRGFASITNALVAARKVCAPNSEYFHFKSDSWISEVAQMPSQLCSYWAPMLAGEYQLPEGGPKLSIVVTKKIG